MSDAKGSPKTRKIPDLEARIARIEKYEAWGALEPLPLGDLAGPEFWDQHWQNLAEIHQKMHKAQKHAEKVNQSIKEALPGYKSR